LNIETTLNYLKLKTISATMKPFQILRILLQCKLPNFKLRTWYIGNRYNTAVLEQGTV